MLRPVLQPTLEKRSVVDRQVHGEADGRRGKYPQEQPALPVVERAGRPEDEYDKEEGPEHSLNNRLPVERIHIKRGLIGRRRTVVPLRQNVESVTSRRWWGSPSRSSSRHATDGS